MSGCQLMTPPLVPQDVEWCGDPLGWETGLQRVEIARHQ
jgi:hypothetical protein